MKLRHYFTGILCAALFCVAALAGDPDSGKDDAGKSGPSEENPGPMRGQSKAKGEWTEFLYDFKKTDQAKDFHVQVIHRDSKGDPTGSSWGEIKCEAGKLLLPKGDMVYWNHSVKKLELLQLSVSGVNSMDLTIWGKKGNTWVNIGESTGISISTEPNGVRMGPEDHAPFRLDPKKTYRVELSLDKKIMLLKIDGKKIAEEAIPDQYVWEGSIGFSGGDGTKPYLSSIFVRGSLAKEPTPPVEK